MQYKMFYKVVRGHMFDEEKHLIINDYIPEGWEPLSLDIFQVDENPDDPERNAYHLAILARRSDN